MVTGLVLWFLLHAKEYFPSFQSSIFTTRLPPNGQPQCHDGYSDFLCGHKCFLPKNRKGEGYFLSHDSSQERETLSQKHPVDFHSGPLRHVTRSRDQDFHCKECWEKKRLLGVSCLFDGRWALPVRDDESGN